MNVDEFWDQHLALRKVVVFLGAFSVSDAWQEQVHPRRGVIHVEEIPKKFSRIQSHALTRYLLLLVVYLQLVLRHEILVKAIKLLKVTR